MSYRALSPREIADLGQQYQARREWEGMRAFVHALYGPTAVLVILEILSMYNDFRYDDHAVLHVFDAEGLKLWYDFTQPWWLEHGLTSGHVEAYLQSIAEYEETLRTEQRPGYHEETVAFGPEAVSGYFLHSNEELPVKQFFTAATGLLLLERPQPGDAINITYDLTTAPPIAHTRILVPSRP